MDNSSEAVVAATTEILEETQEEEDLQEVATTVDTIEDLDIIADMAIGAGHLYHLLILVNTVIITKTNMVMVHRDSL